MNKKITILGIESSCDETAASIIQEENGKIKITENQMPKDNWPENMACPDLLKQKFHEERLAKVLHLGHFCQAIWDKSKNKYQTMIFGHSCN